MCKFNYTGYSAGFDYPQRGEHIDKSRWQEDTMASWEKGNKGGGSYRRTHEIVSPLQVV